VARQVLNLGVIGVGLIGSLHARIITQLPNACLTAIADIDSRKAENAGKEYGCPSYFDYRELLRSRDVDAVAICVPDDYHVDVSVQCAHAGKHILLEKPLAKTPAEAQQILDAVEEAGVRLMVAHILRFDPRYVQLHDALTRGDLGEPIHLRLRRQNPASSARRHEGSLPILRYLGIHDADLIRWYAQSEVQQVFAQKVSKLHADIGIEDAVVALLTFESGAIGSIELSWALPDTFPAGIYASAEVIGTRGVGYVNILDQGLSIYSEKGISCPDTLHWPEINGEIVGDLRDEIDHFVKCTLDDIPYVMSNEDAIAAVRIIDACAESIRTNRPVLL
jgi:predicted dehydrogenase